MLPPAEDVQATLLALTARSVADAVQRWAMDAREILVCGGGVHNPLLMRALRDALAPRRVPYPAFEVVRPSAHVAWGTVRVGPVPAKPWKDRSLTDIGPQLGGYPEACQKTRP